MEIIYNKKYSKTPAHLKSGLITLKREWGLVKDCPLTVSRCGPARSSCRGRSTRAWESCWELKALLLGLLSAVKKDDLMMIISKSNRAVITEDDKWWWYWFGDFPITGVEKFFFLLRKYWLWCWSWVELKSWSGCQKFWCRVFTTEHGFASTQILCLKRKGFKVDA